MRLRIAASIAALAAASAAAGDRAPVAYVVVDGAGAPEPLTAAPADAARGGALAADPVHACLDCHDGEAAADPETLAALSSPRARLAIIDFAVLDPAYPGHAFYDIDASADGETVAETRLTALEVEDLVAWLASLRERPALSD